MHTLIALVKCKLSCLFLCMHIFAQKCTIKRKYIIFCKACCNYWKIWIKKALLHHFNPNFFLYVSNFISNYFRCLKIPLSNVDFEHSLLKRAKISKKYVKNMKKHYFCPIFLQMRFKSIMQIVTLAMGFQNQCSYCLYLPWFVSNRVCSLYPVYGYMFLKIWIKKALLHHFNPIFFNMLQTLLVIISDA